METNGAVEMFLRSIESSNLKGRGISKNLWDKQSYSIKEKKNRYEVVKW